MLKYDYHEQGALGSQNICRSPVDHDSDLRTGSLWRNIRGMKSIFITGTDTGVGKTVLTAALLDLIRVRGVDAVPVKPVQTGCEELDGVRQGPDLDFCLRAAAMHPSPAQAARWCPVRLHAPASPHLAAQREGRTLSARDLAHSVTAAVEGHDAALVEGAGGLLVPLNAEETILDLMVELDFPVLVAARPALGTLNHTLLTLEALAHRRLEVLGVVLLACSPEPPGYIEADNLATLCARAEVPVFGPLPWLPGLADDPDPGPRLRAATEPLLGPLCTTWLQT